MRAIIFSDSHGNIENCKKAMERSGKVDLIIHLGDICRDVVALSKTYPDIPIESVVGNNDYGAIGEKTKVITFDGHKILMTHGHLFRDTVELSEYAEMRGAEIGLFGHTHMKYREKLWETLVVNPGSISRPRDGSPSFGIIETEEKKLSIATIEI